jgi:hypothetical protein
MGISFGSRPRTRRAVRGRAWGLFIAVVGAAAVIVVPAAPAAATAGVQLALLPLPAASLGAPVSGLAVAHDSGVVSNAAAAAQTSDATASTLAKLGRVTGYALDYGYPASGAQGIADVTTSVEQYKTALDAKHGLAFWKTEFSQQASLNAGGFSAAFSALGTPAVGSQHFAYRTSYSASNIAPLTTVNELFADNRYVLEVDVSAGTAAAAAKLAPSLAAKFAARLQLALKGSLKATPVKLPPPQTAGKPAGGPDLSTLALTTSDLTSDTPQLLGEGYFVDPQAISDYSVGMNLGFQGITQGILDQEIEWYPNANAAAFNADLVNAVALSQDPSRTTVVDLSSLGHGAQGSVTQGTAANPISTGTIVLSHGQLAEFIFIAVQGAIGTQDPVTNVATAAANHITTLLGP